MIEISVFNTSPFLRSRILGCGLYWAIQKNRFCCLIQLVVGLISCTIDVLIIPPWVTPDADFRTITMDFYWVTLPSTEWKVIIMDVQSDEKIGWNFSKNISENWKIRSLRSSFYLVPSNFRNFITFNPFL